MTAQDVTHDLIPVLLAFKRLSISKNQGWKLIARGDLRTVKIGRLSYTTPEWIKEFISKLGQGSRDRSFN